MTTKATKAPNRRSTPLWWAPVATYCTTRLLGDLLPSVVSLAATVGGVVWFLATGGWQDLNTIGTGELEFETAVPAVLTLAGLVATVMSFKIAIAPEQSLNIRNADPLARLLPEASSGLGGHAILRMAPYTKNLIESSNELDAWLRYDEPDIRVVEADSSSVLKTLKDDAATNRTILWALARDARRQSPPRLFTNGSMAVLATDLRPGTEEVRIWKGSYYTSQLLNERAMKNFVDGNDPGARLVYSADDYVRSHLLVGGTKRLRAIPEMDTSPHLGVNTVAVCSDGVVALLVQSKRANYSGGLLAPTGSGSMDWEDFGMQSQRRSLLDAARFGAQRELREESHPAGALMRDHIARTEIVGFFRNVNRGCLPGFLMITQLSIESGEIVANLTEVEQPRWEMEMTFFARTAKELAANAQEWADSKSRMVSTPLFANLRAIARWAHQNDRAANGFLGR